MPLSEASGPASKSSYMYDADCEVGHGEFGVVYKVINKEGYPLAMKRGKTPDDALSIKHERDKLQQLEGCSPYVIEAVDFFELNGSPGDFCLVLPLCGRKLTEEIKDCKSDLDLKKAVVIGGQLAEGLAAVHKKRIQHGECLAE